MVERRKILGRAASARDDDDVDVVLLVEVTQSGGYLMRCTLSLHLRRIDKHIYGMMPAFENVENVSQRGSLRRCDDADPRRQRRNRFFSLGGEQPFRLKLGLELLKCQLQ